MFFDTWSSIGRTALIGVAAYAVLLESDGTFSVIPRDALPAGGRIEGVGGSGAAEPTSRSERAGSGLS